MYNFGLKPFKIENVYIKKKKELKSILAGSAFVVKNVQNKHASSQPWLWQYWYNKKNMGKWGSNLSHNEHVTCAAW